MVLARLGDHWRLRAGNNEDWAERNRDLLKAGFRTLKEAREAIEAALALDPITSQRVDDPAIADLQRVGPGHYRGRLFGTPVEFVQDANRRWRIEGRSGPIRNLDHLRFGSLWHLNIYFDTW